MHEEDAESLEQRIIYCENIVEGLLKDRLGASNSAQRNAKLKDCIERLQSLCSAVEDLSLFSINDQIEDLPTSLLRFLLIHAYLAYIMQEIQVNIEERKTYLLSAKANYREFLQNLLSFELISFKLHWLGTEDQIECNSKLMDAPKITDFEEASARRADKIKRLNQIKELEDALDKLKYNEQRNNDEAEQREIIFLLLRLWSIRAIKDLDTIEGELKMLEEFDARKNNSLTTNLEAKKKFAEMPLKPFIIARSQQQKQVFGLGYPSIPTVTVDEWFDQMQKNGGFGKVDLSRERRKKMNTFTIDKTANDISKNEDEDDETKRQAKIRMDQWKDMNPRGSGNTYNKG